VARIRISLIVIVSVCVVVGWSLGGGASLAAEGDDDAPIVVVDIGDPIDQRMIDFVVATLDERSAHAFVLEIDSPGVSSGELAPLFAAIAGADAPVISWIGPNPAVAFGGAAYLANQTDIRAAAPGVSVGYLDPAVQRGDALPPDLRISPGNADAIAATVDELRDDVVVVSGDGPSSLVPGFVDTVQPALGQLLISLDGEAVTRGSDTFILDTAATETIDGQEVVVQSRPVTFVKPGLLDRFLRLGARPETAFLFLVLGIAFAVFEFYAAGTGLMAFVASLALILSGYGMATLPIWWPAVAAVVAGSIVQVWGFAQNRVDWRAVLGTILVFAGGATFTTSRPQYPPALWMVTLATAAGAVFIWYSLTTVVRGRFATPTFGREELLGRRCRVVTTLDPVGVVVVDGARWRATADRGVQIAAGAPAEIVGVTGLLLEVDPVGPSGGPADGDVAPRDPSE
jgi:membrane-bound serine protease (ClpP class)